MSQVLTNSLVQKLEPKEKPWELGDAKLKGLLVRVQPTGRKTFYFSYRNTLGKKNRFKIGEFGYISVPQARDLAKRKAADVTHGKDIQAERNQDRAQALAQRERTLERYLDDHYGLWVTTHRKSGDSTLARIKRDFKDFLSTPIDSIGVQNIEQWRAKRLRGGTKGTTLNRSTSTLRAALEKAVDWEILSHNPLAKLKRLKVESDVRVRYLTDDEYERLFESLKNRDQEIVEARARANRHRAARQIQAKPSLEGYKFGDRLTPMVTLALKSGLRRGELFDLRVDDIDFQASSITVRGDSSKSGKSRSIPISETTLETLTEWLNSRRIDCGRVFPGDSGGRLVTLKKSFAHVLEKAQIDNFRWHDMRHDFASRLVMRGVPLNTVRELCGHADLSTTLRYAHLAPDHKSDAIAMLG